MIIQCAWCKKHLGEKAPLKDVSVTHSICESCMKEIAKKNPPVDWGPVQGATKNWTGRVVGKVRQYLLYANGAWELLESTGYGKDPKSFGVFHSKVEALAYAGIRAARHLVGKNPGETWHAEKEREAEASEKKVKKSSLKDFYHGKAIAHFESALAAGALKRAARSYVKPNPIAVFGLGNPPNEVHSKVAGIVYRRCVEVRAEKTGSFNRGLWKHPFARKSAVQVLALDNGDLLLHSVAGIRLWKKA